MQASHNGSRLLRLAAAPSVERLPRSVLFLRRSWASIGLALALFVVLVLVLAPLLSFIVAVIIGAAVYALFGQHGGARLGRMRMTDLYGHRRGSARTTALFVDLSALALLGGGVLLLASADALSAEATIAAGLAAALVLVARTV